jgi:hypothetical protein
VGRRKKIELEGIEVATVWEEYLERHRKITDIETVSMEIIGFYRAQSDAKLKEDQKNCSPHIDDGGMFEGHCTKCGIGFG